MSISVRLLTWILLSFATVTPTKLHEFLGSHEKDYEKALDDFVKNINLTFSPTSAFKVWHQSVNRTLSYDDKLKLIKGNGNSPGDNGKPVVLQDNLDANIMKKIDKGWKEHAFNEFVSDLIPLDRVLPDVRDEWCHNQNYSSRLPQASVVICFYNEAWSTLMRTVRSVLNRTPKHLLKEIILFDDFSRLKYVSTLKEDLRNLTNVKLVRAPARQGLIRARMQALDYVTAPVVVYLDSHCECTKGWLEPLLDRIARDTTRVVSPVVDRIDDDTFEYISQDIANLKVGGFNWDQYLRFTWKSVKKDALSQRSHPAEPIETATISGGLFAISVRYFKRIGQYDPEFNVWGAENLELSFKTWMCGGSAEIVPCSHVGHVFRSRFPYDGVGASAQRNIIRLVEVWLDHYKKYYHETIGNHLGNFGNISERINLRKSLKCNSFEWYLKKFDNYLQLPDQYVARGQIVNMYYNTCLTANVQLAEEAEVTLEECHNFGGDQFWHYTSEGELTRNELCLDLVLGRVKLFACYDREPYQVWLYDEKTNNIKNTINQECLSVKSTDKGTKLYLDTCTNSTAQMWRMENFDAEKLAQKLKTTVEYKTASVNETKL